jgi:cephalosporin-C deacetylase
MKRHFSFLLLLVQLLAFSAMAQPVERLIKVMVAPDRSDWTYKTGDPVKFTISVTENGNPLKNVSIKYTIGLEKLDPTTTETVTAENGTTTVKGGTLKTPGFLRCIATVNHKGYEYRGFATAGFSPEKIEPTVSHPSDFDTFWATAKEELAKVPLDARITLLPEKCTETVNVYHVNIQNYKVGARLYGMLAVPKKEGKYPALLHVPGAGIRGYGADIANAEKGIITLSIGIHGVPVTMDPGVYNDMIGGWANQYWTYNMDDRDRFYYKRVYLGCVRANDFLSSLPQYDGSNLAVTGGSQGGALSIVTAALDSRVKFLTSLFPALSDVTGYLHGRAGGWPHYFDKNNASYNNKREKLETVGYYDVVNFARRLTIPGFYSWGYNDETCPPTSMYAAYNKITAPKELFLALETGHWVYPEQKDKVNNWLISKLKGSN